MLLVGIKNKNKIVKCKNKLYLHLYVKWMEKSVFHKNNYKSNNTTTTECKDLKDDHNYFSI